MTLASLLEHASSLASLDLQRDGFVPSAQGRGEIIDISNQISEALTRSTPETGDLPALYAQASKQLAVNLSIVSPVRRLPPELLTSIFFEISPGSPFDRGPLLARTVACVCFTWRAAVLGMPLLWSYISSERMSPLDSYAAQIRRSGDLPLHLRHCDGLRMGLEQRSSNFCAYTPRAGRLSRLRPRVLHWRRSQ